MCGGVRAAPAGVDLRPGVAPPPPNIPWGGLRWGRFAPAPTGAPLRPTAAPPPPPRRSFPAERGDFHPAERVVLPFPLPHAVRGGGRGGGAAHHPTRNLRRAP